MPLMTPQKEAAIRQELFEIFDDSEAHTFLVDRQIISKTHFEANTAIEVDGRREVRYLQIYFTGFENLVNEQQSDDDCVPVRLNYTGQVGFQYIEERSDNSTSDDSVTAYILNMRNKGLNNRDLIISGETYELGFLTEVVPLRVEDHPVLEFPTHIWDFRFYVEVWEK